MKALRTRIYYCRRIKKERKKVIIVDERAQEHPADYADYADYGFPDFKTERIKILDKWKSFVENANKGTVYEFNWFLIQNPMCETMMRFGMDLEASRYRAIYGGRVGIRENDRKIHISVR